MSVLSDQMKRKVDELIISAGTDRYRDACFEDVPESYYLNLINELLAKPIEEAKQDLREILNYRKEDYLGSSFYYTLRDSYMVNDHKDTDLCGWTFEQQTGVAQ